MKPILTIALILLAGSATPILAQTGANPKAKAAMDRFVSSLMSKMTLDEKIGQLNLPTSGDFTTGQAGNSDIAKKIAEGKVGGLFNIKSVAKIR